MKQTLTFNLSTIASTESKIKVDYFDTSVEAFDNGEYLQSFYALLDYVNDEFRESTTDHPRSLYSPRSNHEEY